MGEQYRVWKIIFRSLLSSKHIFAIESPYAFYLVVNEATAVFEIFTSVSLNSSVANLAIVANFYAPINQIIWSKGAKMDSVFFQLLNFIDQQNKTILKLVSNLKVRRFKIKKNNKIFVQISQRTRSEWPTAMFVWFKKRTILNGSCKLRIY